VLGDGTETNSRTPVAAVGLADVRSVSVGAKHSAAVRLDGVVMSWGSGGWGAMGDGTKINSVTVAVPAAGIDDGIAAAAGSSFTIALLADGTVKAWGRNEAGQLGDGTTETRYAPATVPDL
jgi:alpha-tubulin suppressor-like RCC1 family protein